MREAVWLMLILSPVLGGISLLWKQVHGEESLLAFAWAAGICVAYGILALVGQEIYFRRDSQFTGSLVSILLRTLGPLLSAVILTAWQPGLIEQQIFPAFVVCYLLTLFVETVLSVCLIQRWERRLSSVKPSLPSDSKP